MTRTPWRLAYLQVNSLAVSLDQFSSLLGHLDIDESKVLKDGSCGITFRSRGAPQATIDDHLEDLWDRASAALEILSASDLGSLDCRLEIVQEMGATDESGPGFLIDQRWVRALARVDGRIDVDLSIVDINVGGKDQVSKP
jgi:hypothetical protein